MASYLLGNLNVSLPSFRPTLLGVTPGGPTKAPDDWNLSGGVAVAGYEL